jgi:hypothetical protein
MIDAPGRAQARFPAALEDAVRAAITDELTRHDAGPYDIGVGSAACGSDVLFAECLLARGVALRLCLPFPEPEFLAASVAFAGSGWVERFHAVAARARVAIFPPTSPIARVENDPYKRTNLWMIENARSLGGRDIVFLCVWDGEGGDGPGGTAHMVHAVQAAGGSVVRIDPMRL